MTEPLPRAVYRRTGNEVILLARTGGRRTVRVRATGTNKPAVFGVYPWELLDSDTRRSLDKAVIAALPWAGKGKDPLDPQGSRALLANMPSKVPPGPVHMAPR